MSVGRLYVVFGEVSIQVLCPFLNQVVYFLLLIYMTSLCILFINCLSDKSFAHIFSQLVDYLLVSLIVPFAMQKLFSFIQSHLFILLLFPMPEETYKKKLLRLLSKSIQSMVSSRKWMVSGLTFESSSF